MAAAQTLDLSADSRSHVACSAALGADGDNRSAVRRMAGDPNLGVRDQRQPLVPLEPSGGSGRERVGFCFIHALLRSDLLRREERDQPMPSPRSAAGPPGCPGTVIPRRRLNPKTNTYTSRQMVPNPCSWAKMKPQAGSTQVSVVSVFRTRMTTTPTPATAHHLSTTPLQQRILRSRHPHVHHRNLVHTRWVEVLHDTYPSISRSLVLCQHLASPHRF